MSKRWTYADLPAERPELSDIPIPRDVKVTRAWTPLMRELATHIGPYATMLVVDRFGGLDFTVPMSAEGWHLADLIGADKAAILCGVFARERLHLPTAKHALALARRAAIIAAVRSGELTLSQAAWILRMKMRWVWQLVHNSDEGMDAPPPLPEGFRQQPRQLDFLED